MTDVKKILIVGGGVGGMSLAICLRRLNLSVDLIDRDPDWRALGAGLSLNGATLKAFQRVDGGVFERMRAEGHMHSGMALYTPAGMLIRRMEPPGDESGVPQGGGILRPVLHQILAEATRRSGARVRLGVTVSSLVQQSDKVRVRCSDGEEASYDVVVGADGLHSQIRSMIFPEGPRPRFTGQGCWRAVFPRPPGFDTVAMYLDSFHKAGLNPVSRDQMYLFLLEAVPGNPWMPEEEWPRLLAERLQPFGGQLAALRGTLDERASVNYRPLETVLLPSPWYKGRVLLIGDAAHATTPHSAYGCGLAVEDAVVLSELLGSNLPIAEVLEQFMARRFRRCKVVVDGSVKLGELEMAHASVAEHQAVSAQVGMVIAEPI
jgi:2-polyprenyl-6-methoxyphenol hydroxylase-like FAD-dependent oxidoreductase